MLGNIQEHFEDVKTQCTMFVTSCYGYPNQPDMTSLRYKVWTNKMSNHKLNSAPKLRILPPTTEAFDQYVKGAHLQAAIWRSTLDSDPPKLDPVDYGFYISTESNKFEPVALSADVSPAPESVLKVIKCGCSTSQPYAPLLGVAAQVHIYHALYFVPVMQKLNVEINKQLPISAMNRMKLMIMQKQVGMMKMNR